MAGIPSGIGVWWPTGAIPSGWDRNTDFDSRFSKGTASGVNPNVTGGLATHTHSTSNHNHTLASHTHTYVDTGTTFRDHSDGGSAGDYYPADGHKHAGTSGSVGGSTSGNTSSSWADGSSNPSYYSSMYIESDGTEDGFPDGCVVYYNSGSVPSEGGWTQHAASQQRYIYGGTGGTGGGSHTHSAASHTHSADTSTHQHPTSTTGDGDAFTRASTSGGYGVNTTAHYHQFLMGSSANASTASATTSGGTGSYTNLPPYRILLGIENTSNENNWLESAIVMWVGTLANIPDDWTLCDGGGGTPDLRNKFILMASSGGGDVGGTSGTDGHTHSAPSTHTHSGSGSHTHSWPHDTFYNSGMMGTSSYTRSGGVGRWGVGTGATHYHPSGTSAATTPGYGSGTQTISTTSDTQPAFRTVAYLMAPEEPSSGNAMFFAGNF